MKRRIILLSIFLLLLITGIKFSNRQSKHQLTQQIDNTELEESDSLDIENVIVQKIKNVLYFFRMF